MAVDETPDAAVIAYLAKAALVKEGELDGAQDATATDEGA